MADGLTKGRIDARVGGRADRQVGHVDLTRISLVRLKTADPRVLDKCLARVLREADATMMPIAYFDFAMQD